MASYPGIVKTKLDGVNQLDYLSGKSEKSAREVFFYYTGPRPSAVRYKNWKFYYTMVGSTGPLDGSDRGRHAITGLRSQNIKRDPFETTVGSDRQDSSWAWAVRWPAPAPRISTTGTSCPSASCCG